MGPLVFLTGAYALEFPCVFKSMTRLPGSENLLLSQILFLFSVCSSSDEVLELVFVLLWEHGSFTLDYFLLCLPSWDDWEEESEKEEKKGISLECHSVRSIRDDLKTSSLRNPIILFV